ncbi:hypothetical protein K3495_g3954 [Podosphaera aphanis]|nr:hypothetical protein K3495_g3954 [Podosphaera aphanis]
MSPNRIPSKTNLGCSRTLKKNTVEFTQPPCPSNIPSSTVEVTPASSPIHTRPSSPIHDNLPVNSVDTPRLSSLVSTKMPGNFAETPRPHLGPLPFTPVQSSNQSIPQDSPRKPYESFILHNISPVPPINFQPTQSLSTNRLNVNLSSRSTREKKQANPGDGMVPNTQQYRANAVQFEPKTFKQAMKSVDHELWGKAVEEEMDALNRNDTWEIVTRPQNRNVVGSKWVFKIKRKADGSIERYKARLVAKGFSPQPGRDCDDTYAPVARYDSLRLLLALAAHKRWKPRQLDVKSAFYRENWTERYIWRFLMGLRNLANFISCVSQSTG